jgi:hypothetical protein
MRKSTARLEFSRSLVLSAGSLLVIAGCRHDGVTGATTPREPGTGAGPVSRRAIAAITSTRCDREAACDNIGRGRKYPTREMCVDDVRGRGLSELTAGSCASGIDSPQLNGEELQECLAQIRADPCDRPSETLSGLGSCGTYLMCSH